MLVGSSERERACAERKLQRLADAAEHGSDAIVSIDADRLVRRWNPGAERLYGFTAEEAIGRTIRELIGVDDESREFALLMAGEPAYQFETRRRRKDGTIIEVLLTVSPWMEDGRQVGVTGVAIDLTERKQVERTRARALADLEDSQRTARLGSSHAAQLDLVAGVVEVPARAALLDHREMESGAVRDRLHALVSRVQRHRHRR